MYALTTFALGDFNNPIPVEVSGCFAEIERIRTTQGVLCFAVRICVESCDFNAVLGGSATNPSVQNSNQQKVALLSRRPSAIWDIQGYFTTVGD